MQHKTYCLKRMHGTTTVQEYVPSTSPIFWGLHETSMGKLFLAVQEHCLIQLAFGADQNPFDPMLLETGNENTLHTEPLVQKILTEQSVDFCAKGSLFQVRVWEATLKIPHGEQWTYGQIAQALDQPKAARAVGQALNKNPIALVIPCHRVISPHSQNGGYRWGASLKAKLLQKEQVL